MQMKIGTLQRGRLAQTIRADSPGAHVGVSTGILRSVLRMFLNRMRTGLFLVARIRGPRYWFAPQGAEC